MNRLNLRRLAGRLRVRLCPRRADLFQGDYVSSASPIVIGGCGRSGTTLLRVMLDAHPNICCGPESGLFYHRSLGFRGLAAGFGVPRDLLRKLHRESSCRAELIERFFQEYCARRQKPRWAEKTPKNITCLGFLFAAFPRARFIHLLRDGRDVACSLRTHPSHEMRNGKLVPLKTWRPIAECARRWVSDIEASRPYWTDPRFMTLRYEDLVTRTAESLRQVLDFVGEAWDDAVLTHHQKAGQHDVARFAPSAAAVEPVRTSSLGRWRNDLSDSDKEAFKAVAGSLLVELGYASSHDW